MKKSSIKQLLGDLPITAEIYWLLRQTGKPPVGGYSLAKLQAALPAWISQVKTAQQPKTGQHIFVFTMLSYWVEQTVAMCRQHP